MSRRYGKIYSERSLESFDGDTDRNTGRFSLGDNSDNLFGILRDIVSDVLDKSPHELQQLAFMNQKIAQVIIKSDSLSRLTTPTQLKAVLFQMIILIKQQCLSSEKPDKLQVLQLRLKYNTLRRNYLSLENTLNQAKKLVNDGGVLLDQIVQENEEVLRKSKSKRIRVDIMHKSFEVMRRKIEGLGRLGSSRGSSNGSRDDSRDGNKDSVIERLEESLETRGQEITSLKIEFESYRSKCEKTLKDLNQQKQQAKQQVIMLRSRVQDVRQQSRNKSFLPPLPPTKPIQSQKDLMVMLLMQSLSLQQVLA